MKLGLLGGSFNPVHNGHLAVAQQARKALGLDQILFIPSSDPPHKPSQNLASGLDRAEMIRRAIVTDPGLVLSNVELQRSGTSYSIDTIRQLQKDYGPKTQLVFLIGLDAFLDFPTWRDSLSLLTLCPFVVLSRPGMSFSSLSTLSFLPPTFSSSLTDLDAGRISRLEIPLEKHLLTCLKLTPCTVSASEIRTRILQGRPLANLLPTSVESYIVKHALYQEI